VAYLLLNGPEEAIKLFYSPVGPLRLRPRDLVAVLLAYFGLNISVMGLAVPMGSFIPNMFIGAASGRLLGHLLQELNLPFSLAEPSVYALIGSAAMLGGSLRQTLSIVVFLTECINDMNLIPVLMVSVFVSHTVANMLGERGLDEELIVRKGVRYLDPELPKEMDSVEITAVDLCVPLPPSARLAPIASVYEVRQALQECDSGTFPVLDAGRCLGLVTRKRLMTAVDSLQQIDRCNSEQPRVDKRCTQGALADEDDDLRLSQFITEICRTTNTTSSGSEDGEPRLALHRLMDKAPFTLLETMPLPRFHPLFTRIDVNAACVVSADGDFVGLLSRSSLIDAALLFEEGSAEVTFGSASQTVLGAEAIRNSSSSADVELGRRAEEAASLPPPPPMPQLPSSSAAVATEADDVARLTARIAQLEAALAAVSAPRATTACADGMCSSLSSSVASSSTASSSQTRHL